MILAGFDVGTTAVKGIYFDARDRRGRRRGVVGVRAAPTPRGLRRAGSRRLARRPQRRAGTQLDAAAPGIPVAAIGICSQVNTHVFVDADLAPLHPAINWQDQRCAEAGARAGTASRRRQRAHLRRAVLDRRLVRAEPGAVAAADTTRRRGPRLAGSCRRRTSASPRSPGPCAPTGCRPSASSAPTASYLAGALALVDGAASTDCRRSTSSTPSPDRPPGRSDFPSGLPVSVGTMDAWSSLYGSGVVRAGPGRGDLRHLGDRRRAVRGAWGGATGSSRSRRSATATSTPAAPRPAATRCAGSPACSV